ncbi:MAG: T9SS type A sorting domain-containing protein [Candidatus Kapabacteria bacterium]|nr:T9SS type A sorting domain-containing protein [Candidatus Kapabacteria bacterium]
MTNTTDQLSKSIAGEAMIRNVTRYMSLFVVALLVGITSASATNTSYSVAPLNGNYQELTFGTTHVSGSNMNDEVINVPLGFNFTVGNTVFTSVFVHTNGYVSFGGSGIYGNAYRPLQSTDAATVVVAAWGNDLMGKDDSSIMTQLQGTPGNYTFVIQWKNVTRPSGVTMTKPERYNFQVRLVQVNNGIDIVYGEMVVNSPHSVHIGMRGVENTGSVYSIVADYNRNTWAQPSISMTAAPSTPERNFAPAVGQTYRFTRRVAPGSNNDVAIINLGTQAANYAAGTSQAIVARIKNFGTNNLDSVIIEWKVNGGNRTAVKYYPQPAIAPLGEATVTLGYETFGAKSWNTLWAHAQTVNGQNDPVVGNNTYSTWTAPAVSGNLTIATIGVNSAAFTSFRDVMRHLRVSGINGDVNVNVYGGSYIENLYMPALWTSTPGLSVRFAAVEGQDVEIRNRMPPIFVANQSNIEFARMLNFDGMSDVSFSNISFVCDPGGLMQSTVRMSSTTRNVSFNECSFMGLDVNETRGDCLEIYADTVANFSFTNNTIENHSTAFAFISGVNSNVVIKGNSLRVGCAVYATSGNLEFVNNDVTVPASLTSFGSKSVLVNYNDGITIANNTIDASEASIGLLGIQLEATVGTSSVMRNNMIVVGGPSESFDPFSFGPTESLGVYIYNTGGTVELSHNTINMVSKSRLSTGLFIGNANPNSTQGARIVNNIFHNFGQGKNGGYAIRVEGNSTTALSVSDFNDIVTTGSVLARYNNSDVANLATWRAVTGRDQNSVSIPVDFVSASDVHLNSIQTALLGSGTLFGIVPTDIDGEKRLKPYMGADEIQPEIEIVTEPQSRYACNGESFTLTCIANVTPGAVVTYQWYKDGVIIPNEKSAILAFNNVGYPSAGVYMCSIEATDRTTTVAKTSAKASIFVVRGTQVTIQPSSQPVALGGTVNLSVAAEAVGAPQDYVPAYQWKKKYWSSVTNSYQDSLVRDNGRITGSTSSMMTIRNLTNADTLDQYFCTITGYCGTVDSKTARLFVPRVIASNTTPAACISSSIVLECTAVPGALPGGSIGYQWYKDGAMLSDNGRTSGSTTKNLTITDANDTTDNGEYWCVATYMPSGTEIASNKVDIAVGTSPIIVLQPVGDTLCEGNSMQLTAGATGTGITYQWMKGGVAIPNAAGSALTVQNITAADAGQYSVMVLNSCGQVTSSTVNVLVNVAPRITDAPTDKAVVEGDEIKLEVAASGSGTLSYQWYKGTTQIDGATETTFTVARATGDDQGDYTVVVSNECGADTSTIARVGVTVGVTGDVVENGYTLGMANPNPSSDAVRFSYTLPAAQFVRIALTDVLGREIAELNSGVAEAGTHRLSFSSTALGLTPGVYLYTISTPGFAATQQVVIVK